MPTKPKSRARSNTKRPTKAQQLARKLAAAEATIAELRAAPQPDPRLPHRYTDAGIAEHNEQLRAAGKLNEGPRVTMKADAWDRQLEARNDACDGKLNPWEAPDPLAETVALHAQPGMRYRFLSERVIKRRGMRHWEPVLDANGQMIKVGDVFLARMPEERAISRNNHYQRESSELVTAIQESHDEKVERISREARNLGLRVLKPGEVVTDSSFPAHKTAIGVSVTRGAVPA